MLDQQVELQRRLAAAEQAEQHYLRLASELQFQSSQILALKTSVSNKQDNRDKRRQRNEYCFLHGYTSTHTGNECYVMANPDKKAQDGGTFTQGMIKSTDGAATNETRSIRGKMGIKKTDDREIFVTYSANSISSNYKNSEKYPINITQITNSTTIQATLDCGAKSINNISTNKIHAK